MPEDFNADELDFLGMNLALEKAKAEDTSIPAWMVSSDKAKLEMRDAARQAIKQKIGLSYQDSALLELLRKMPQVAEGFKQWKEHEQMLSQERANNNPTAFFIHQ